MQTSYNRHTWSGNRVSARPVDRAAERGRTAPGDAPALGKVWVWALLGPARVWSAGLGGKAEDPEAADPSPDDKPVSLPGPELPVGWEASGRTGLPTSMIAAAAGSLSTFCIKHQRTLAFL